MRILFQGDSITNAFRRPEEINPAFQLGNGYAFIIAARLAAAHPDQHFEFLNRGVSGDNTADLLNRWDTDALDVRPDLLSLLIGINDVGAHHKSQQAADPPHFEKRYRALLDPLSEANPALKMILLEPFLLPAGEDRTPWQETLRGVQSVAASLAAEYKAVFVPLQQIFDEASGRGPAAYWSYDGIHATHAGFQLIADAWLAAAGSLLEPMVSSPAV
jgi:lysophospholipase L1-like esterase